MEIIDTPDLIKERHINSYQFSLVKTTSMKSSSKLFGVLRQYIRSKIRKYKNNKYMIITKLDVILRTETNNHNSGRQITKVKIDKSHGWICNHPHIFNAPLNNEHVNNYDHRRLVPD